jgi:DNA helicase-2/ATP-dependent DNA helicase PcrA
MNLSLDLLNERQLEAVMHTEGPCMIIAGPGAGKTRVLTTRIAYLIQEKCVDPFRILALTFTNKAANEMKSRIEQVVGSMAKNVWLGTFHSCFARILRIEADKLGYPADFSIYDTTDSKSLLKTIMKEMGLDDKTYTPNVVLSRISSAKNRLITAQEYISNPIYQQDDEHAMKPRLGEIYVNYVKRCFQAAAMDFDDILLNTYLLFSQHVEVLYKYQDRFQYILIDEFQDTNLAQYNIIKELAAIHQNICIVGDDAQSIYAFRGASIRNILNFEKDYPQLHIVKLEQNYRSTQNIVEVANAVISNNKLQLKKSIWTANERGETIGLIRATTDAEEGRLVASSIFENKMQGQHRNEDFAVLYRTNSQSRSIEEALRKINIPYRMLGGMSFYQRKEIKDLLAYLRFVVNHNDEEALKRIINEPKRGIGPSNIEKLIVVANDHGISLWEAICNAKSFLASRVAEAVEEFAIMIQAMALDLAHKDAYEIASEVAKRSGLLKALYEDKTVEGLSRYENVQELLSGIKAFTVNPEQADTSLTSFLQNIALATDNEELEKDGTDKISLMTIHAAKGLEFKYVYIVGVEEDLFPSPLMLGSKEDLEEERRLFYVALTRAKAKIFLSYSMSRYRFGKLKQCEASRFIGEIDPLYLQHVYTTYPSRYAEISNAHYVRKFINSMQPSPRQQSALLYQPTHSPDHSLFQASDTTQLRPGMQVEHPTFGRGRVLAVEAAGAHRKARISFQSLGEKTLLLSFAKLRMIDDVG